MSTSTITVSPLLGGVGATPVSPGTLSVSSSRSSLTFRRPTRTDRQCESNLAIYRAHRSTMPVFARAYLTVCDFLSIDPDSLEKVPRGPRHKIVEGVRVPVRIREPTSQKVTAIAKTLGTPVHHWSCHNPVGCLCASKGGKAACVAISNWLCHAMPVGNSLTRDFFRGSPQEHAILNRHLLDYFASRDRSRQTTPYAIPDSQMHLLSDLGMEAPQPDAPTVPHGLHKGIEEMQLRLTGKYLAPDNYGVISVKSSKLHLLPNPGSVQNPVYEAKDVSRYPGKGVTTVRLDEHPTYLMHDVSSEVTPHELVERLDAENPTGHLFVTGMNPIEVVDRARSFEPSSHEIDYDLNGFNFIFTGSQSESYFTPIDVTVAWLRTSSVKASSGRVYHVVNLDYKLGHCVWHIFSGDCAEQHTRTFGTGSYVRLPPSLTGTLSEEWLPTKLLSGVLAFTTRTPDLSTRNLAAKVAQLATAITPRLTSREQWIATHVAHRMAPIKTWDYWLSRGFWNTLYLLSFQWQMLRPLPDVYSYVDERRRYRVLHPTPGGGWSWRCKSSWKRGAIPNNPTALQRVSAFTSSVFTYLIPKILIGEAITNVVMHVPLWQAIKRIVCWADLQPLRVLLTFAIVVVTAILPGHIVKVFSRLSGHFWRQLWLPGWLAGSVERAITEICGGPGSSWIVLLPGRGWFFQAYLWAIGVLSVLPHLVPHFILPTALVTGHWWVPAVWYLAIVLENLLAYVAVRPLSLCSKDPIVWHQSLSSWFDRFILSDLEGHVGFWESFSRTFTRWRPTVQYHLANCVNVAASAVSPPPSVMRQLPCFVNLPSLPAVPVATIRRRKVDIPLPTVVLQPPNIPAGPATGPLRVDPAGLSFTEWVNAVKAGYRNAATRYPALTPGESCFWDCVATFGGTAHMWYSWHMEFTGERPDPNDPVVGNVTQSTMLEFAGNSKFGIKFSGLCNDVVQSTAGWPTINMVMSHSAVRGLLHVEIAAPLPATEPVANLARILKTIRILWPVWELQFQNSFNGSPVDSSVVPSATLIGMAGQNSMPMTRNAVADAILASFSCTHIDPRNPGNFTLDGNARYPLGFPDLYEFNQPIGQRAVGKVDAATMWHRFRHLGKGFRLKVAEGWEPEVSSPVLKVGHNVAQRRENVRNVTRPDPPNWRNLELNLQDRLKDYVNIILPPVPLEEEVIMYTADLARAARLVSDLKAHPSVLESFQNPMVLQALDSVLDLYKIEGKTVTVPVRAYFGVFGCGKTTATANYLRSLPSDIRRQARVVSHTESLRAQAKSSLDFPELRGFNFPTLASALTESTTGPIVFDDAGKFWGGMLDLIILTNPLLSEVVVNGDPAQGMSKFPVAGTQSEYDATPLAALAPQITRYATVTHRGFKLLADTLGVHTTNTVSGHISHTNEPKVGLPVCTASPRYAGVLAAGGREAYTYASIQGEDFKCDVEVDMTGLEGSVMDRSAYVALTRSSTGVYVHMDAMDPESRLKSNPTGSVLMNALIYATRSGGTAHLIAPSPLIKAAFYRHLAWCMPSLTWFAKVGSSIPAAEFQHVFPAVESHFMAEGALHDYDFCEQVVQVGPAHDNIVREVHLHAKENREVAGRGGGTDQFKEVAFVNPHVHKRSDTATYFLSVEKRLKTQSGKQNLKRMLACPRTDLCDEYDRLVPSPPQWTALKFEQYCERAVSEYCSKRSAGAVMDKLAAHDPDRTGSDIRISLKGQIIKKDEKRDKREAIPGQLIHEYDIKQTIGDAPFALFLEDEIISAFPSNFLFYRRMNPDEFIAAYRKTWRVDNGVHTSDVTRWDVGCDAGVLNFDLHVMTKSGFPRWYIEEYAERRLNGRSQHGPMATMQNSGDRYTWPLNSVRRAVVASLINHVVPEDTVAINGDDEAIDRYCDSDFFPDSPWEFKNLNGERGEFSGFTLGGEIPEYSARGIQYRTMILESRDPSAQNKWLNYLGLLQHADPSTPEAMDVAHSASVHMDKELFRSALPVALRGMFPNIFSGLRS